MIDMEEIDQSEYFKTEFRLHTGRPVWYSFGQLSLQNFDPVHGGINAGEMGLGKTFMMIALFQLKPTGLPNLIVVPTHALKAQW